jgi:hypothetical protein
MEILCLIYSPENEDKIGCAERREGIWHGERILIDSMQRIKCGRGQSM